MISDFEHSLSDTDQSIGKHKEACVQAVAWFAEQQTAKLLEKCFFKGFWCLASGQHGLNETIDYLFSRIYEELSELNDAL